MNYKQGISIVIPTYNSSEYIKKTMDSILNFSCGFVTEVICVDDKSDDIKALQTVLEQYHFVRLITKVNKSNAADSRNIGLENSQCRWVFLLDSDDELALDVVKRRIDLHKNSSYGLIFGNYTTHSNNNTIISSFSWEKEDIRDFILLNGGDFRTSTISIDKEYFKNTAFDSKSFKHQDWIFGIKCFDNDEKLFFDPLPSAIINVDGENRMSNKINLTASRYLVDNYLAKQKHKNGFSRKNWKNVIAANDAIAGQYFFSLFESRTIKDKVVFNIYKAASNAIIIPVTSRCLKILRKAKWQLAIFHGKK